MTDLIGDGRRINGVGIVDENGEIIFDEEGVYRLAGDFPLDLLIRTSLRAGQQEKMWKDDGGYRRSLLTKHSQLLDVKHLEASGGVAVRVDHPGNAKIDHNEVLDYLRSLEMTRDELLSFIAGAVAKWDAKALEEVRPELVERNPYSFVKVSPKKEAYPE